MTFPLLKQTSSRECTLHIHTPTIQRSEGSAAVALLFFIIKSLSLSEMGTETCLPVFRQISRGIAHRMALYWLMIFFWRNYVTLAGPAILSQHSTAVNSRSLMADVGILGKVELGSHAIEWWSLRQCRPKMHFRLLGFCANTDACCSVCLI